MKYRYKASKYTNLEIPICYEDNFDLLIMKHLLVRFWYIHKVEYFE